LVTLTIAGCHTGKRPSNSSDARRQQSPEEITFAANSLIADDLWRSVYGGNASWPGKSSSDLRRVSELLLHAVCEEKPMTWSEFAAKGFKLPPGRALDRLREIESRHEFEGSLRDARVTTEILATVGRKSWGPKWPKHVEAVLSGAGGSSANLR
jgi:hypothetical protein